MTDRGEIIPINAVRFTRLLPGPATRVWDYLTRTESLAAWFSSGVIEPHVGGAVRLMDNHIRGTVTQWHPPHHLTYTWNVFEPGDAEGARSSHPESYLQQELTTQGDNTLLTLTHFPMPEPFQKQTCMGWHTFLDVVEAATRGETPKDRSHYMTTNAALYGVDLNNLAR